MLKQRPELVNMSQLRNDGSARFKPHDHNPGPVAEVPASGFLSQTDGLSAEKGHWILSDIISGAEKALRQEFGNQCFEQEGTH
jgi:creatinine amidohydrolase